MSVTWLSLSIRLCCLICRSADLPLTCFWSRVLTSNCICSELPALSLVCLDAWMWGGGGEEEDTAEPKDALLMVSCIHLVMKLDAPKWFGWSGLFVGMKCILQFSPGHVCKCKCTEAPVLTNPCPFTGYFWLRSNCKQQFPSLALIHAIAVNIF